MIADFHDIGQTTDDVRFTPAGGGDAWQPTAVDAAKLRDNARTARQGEAGRLDDDVGVLALEVIGSLGNRASTLHTVVNGWGNRVPPRGQWRRARWRGCPMQEGPLAQAITGTTVYVDKGFHAMGKALIPVERII